MDADAVLGWVILGVVALFILVGMAIFVPQLLVFPLVAGLVAVYFKIYKPYELREQQRKDREEERARMEAIASKEAATRKVVSKEEFLRDLLHEVKKRRSNGRVS